MFKAIDSKVSFPALEESVLQLWRDYDIFHKSMNVRRGNPQFNFYEGPPTANGSPGIHHVLARSFKDVIVRYRTMKGFYVPRRAGWDTHGLPVELEVEKKLGFTSKTDIERYGIEKFNALCRESVFRYLKEWNALTERIAFWVDLEHPYITLENGYIESCWWIVKDLWDKGLIYQGHRVTPHCPRCGTSLSSHEVALGYDEADDPSVWIKFKVIPGQELLKSAGSGNDAVYLLAWTTTPWTLPGNTALAVSSEDQYNLVEVEFEDHKEKLILAEARLKEAIKKGISYKVLATYRGKDLVNLSYEPLFILPAELYRRFDQGVPRPAPVPQSFHVIAADFVTMTEGTGIVHIAPAFGEADYDAGKQNGLYFVQQVDEHGDMVGSPVFAGKFVKKADPLILADLKSRNILFRSERIKHTYPFCWRCGAPLLYYAKPSWYIKTTAKKEELVAGNETINWYPAHIKEGRFGDWLRNNVDWAFSRERYWGTPLNLWRCQGCGGYKVIGSIEELKSQPSVEGLQEPLDLHRPYVDRINFTCACGGRFQRVPEVLDAWFDSGAMPVAQWHYPFENKEKFKNSFPADFICEGVDQTRGWFYTLHALATMLFDSPCYKNVICLGLVLDAKGEKMSKKRGNVVQPDSVIKKYGADSLRWYLYTASSAGNVRLFSTEQVEQSGRFFVTLWNVYSFFVTYANIDGYDPSRLVEVTKLAELDRWIISELNILINDVNAGLEDYDPNTAARRIGQFVEELSNWYVRRSRRRFWKSENDTDKQAAYSTLYRCLVTVSQLLAPFAPFMAEELWRNLVLSWNPKASESVHLSDFPVSQSGEIDEALSADTQVVMRLVSLGRAARSQANLKVRQPLDRVMVKVRTEGERTGVERFAPQILEEINVKRVELVGDEADLLLFDTKPNLPLLGPKYGKDVPRIVKAFSSLNPTEVARKVSAGQDIEVAEWKLLPVEVLVNSRSKEGYAAATESGYLVAVDTSVSPELAAEGMARELVHRLQSMRKSAGFNIADYIVTYYQSGNAVTEVITKFNDYIKQETLSQSLVQGTPPVEAYKETHKLDGNEITLGVSRLIK